MLSVAWKQTLQPSWTTWWSSRTRCRSKNSGSGGAANAAWSRGTRGMQAAATSNAPSGQQPAAAALAQQRAAPAATSQRQHPAASAGGGAADSAKNVRLQGSWADSRQPAARAVRRGPQDSPPVTEAEALQEFQSAAAGLLAIDCIGLDQFLRHFDAAHQWRDSIDTSSPPLCVLRTGVVRLHAHPHLAHHRRQRRILQSAPAVLHWPGHAFRESAVAQRAAGCWMSARRAAGRWPALKSLN